MSKKLPLGIQTFGKLIEGNFLYVDKTRYIKNLAERYSYVFLSRPRRFGKSLLLSAIGEYFSANHELFKDLDAQPNDIAYPVLRLDFSQIDFGTPEELTASLINLLHRNFLPGMQDSGSGNLKSTFISLIESLHKSTGEKVVILIDEYDKPVTEMIDRPELAEANREVLRSFFGVVKSLDEKIRFMFITGVSKFSKLSLFSGLNQITDITLHPEFSCICGIDQDEMERYFSPHIKKLAHNMKITVADISGRIRSWYNGYSWDGINKVYNPYSLMNLFDFGLFQNYWFNTGTPAFLIKMITAESYDITELENVPALSQTFNSDDLKNINLRGLLFQTGYLTIREVVSQEGDTRYYLSIPNFEVRDSLYKNMVSFITGKPAEDVSLQTSQLKSELINGNPDRFCQIINSLFSSLPYSLLTEQERYFHSLFIMLMYLAGIKTENEVLTSGGRIDSVAETDKATYIIEFKYRKSADKAIEQIRRNEYFNKYKISEKKLILIGINFSKKGIEYQIETVE